MSSVHLQAKDLSRSFQVGKRRIEVLHSISLDIFKGDCAFLCGASGAGKTTLLYTLAGLERPEQGEVVFEDQSLFRLGSDRLSRLRNERMGFVFQGYFLLPELTALENVTLPAMIRGKSGREKAAELLKRVGLEARLNHLPAELSGGEQQRVAIARSLVNDPSILFADEPTGNLDSSTGESIINLLLNLAREDGKTLVVVTHDLELAKRGNRLIRVQDGHLALE